MRTILFRGKCADDSPFYADFKGQWIVGGAVVKKSRDGVFIVGEITQRGYRREVIIDVDPKTVGQYVCDAKTTNGETIQIFEHDVIQIQRRDNKLSVPLVILFEKGAFVFYQTDDCTIVRDFNGYRLPVPSYIKASAGAVTYLGNAHDNPELIQWSDKCRREKLH